MIVRHNEPTELNTNQAVVPSAVKRRLIMMYKQNFVAVIKCNGQILREQGGEVYLPFGAEYSILLKNKDARKALVRIEVDGENVLNGHKLIMQGNESQEIKGFMRDLKKTNRFKFINKTREIQKHRGDRIDDGLVRVTYQFEQDQPIWITSKPWTRTFAPDRDSDFDPSIRRADWTWTDNTSSAIGTRNAFYSSFSCDTSKSYHPLANEGITVKGEKINQAYSYGSIGLLESETHTIILQLKGLTRNKKPLKRPITVKTKLGCNICGRKNKSSNKFCYNCGTYLH
jgi:hypothetical protein